jgi:Primase C terminal 1 (PriCT-1)
MIDGIHIDAGATAPSAKPLGIIPAGMRNHVLTQLAGVMRRHGCSEATIAQALLAENARRCAPPLDEREVRQIATSISRYAPAATAVSPASSTILVPAW